MTDTKKLSHRAFALHMKQKRTHIGGLYIEPAPQRASSIHSQARDAQVLHELDTLTGEALDRFAATIGLSRQIGVTADAVGREYDVIEMDSELRLRAYQHMKPRPSIPFDGSDPQSPPRSKPT